MASESVEATFRVSVILLAVLSLVVRLLGYGDTARVRSVVMTLEVLLSWMGCLVLSRKH